MVKLFHDISLVAKTLASTFYHYLQHFNKGIRVCVTCFRLLRELYINKGFIRYLFSVPKSVFLITVWY
jgi:hypothetical protein